MPEQGGPEVLRAYRRELPGLASGQAMVRVEAAGVSFAEVQMLKGRYFNQPKFPFVPGYDLVGIVEGVGEGVDEGLLGKRVAALTETGAWADLVALDAETLATVPDGLESADAVAAITNGVTAWQMLHRAAKVRPGQVVVVHGASGGVGTLLVQLARLAGAEVIGTASASKHDAIRAQGVQHAIDYRSQDFEQEIRRMTGGEGVDVIMDATGPTNFRKDYRLLREGGRLIMYGLTEASTGTGRDMRKLLSSLVRMPFATVPWWKSLQLMSENKGVFGLNMLAWQDREGLDRVLEPLSKELEAGTISIDPVVAEAFPFERAGEAHRFIAERKNIGKVVLVP